MKFNYCLLVLITFFSTDLHTAGFMPDEIVHSSTFTCEIQNLKVNDEVTSFDGEKLVADQVIKNEAKDCDSGIKILFKNAGLIVTPDQLLYLPKINGWIAAKSLKPDDLVLSITGDLVPVVRTEHLKKVMRFHDLTIKDQHNFFVSKLGILVHNEPISAAAFGLIAGGKAVLAYAAETAVVGTVGYLAYKELSADGKKSNSPFPVIAGDLEREQKAHQQRAEQYSKREAAKQKEASKKAEARKAEQHKILTAEKASVLRSHEKMAKAKAASARTKGQLTKEVQANSLQKNESAGAISEALGSKKSGEEAKKAEENSLGVEGKIDNSEKPGDEEKSNKADEKDNEEQDKEPVVKTVEDLRKESKFSDQQSSKSDKVEQREKSGGYDKAKEDFDALNPSGVKTYPNGTIAGKLPDGRQINVRPESSQGDPTVEVIEGKNRIKIRYK